MPKSSLDARIEQLYQLPLDEFTAARNALAKASGDSAIKRLEKPNQAAWAVNQLYWQERKAYDAVIEAAGQMRAAYKQMLAGKSTDVRAAEAVHDDALRDAKQAARKILEDAGNRGAEAILMAVAETLDALPGEEPPGRLTKPLRRMGFNVLKGVPISAKAGPPKPKVEPAKTSAPARGQTARERRASAAEERERAMNKERLRFAEAAEREAEASLDRATRAVERAERTRERIERELGEAAEAEKKLRKEQAASRAAHDKAIANRDRLAKKLG
jgi:hypothetical protein